MMWDLIRTLVSMLRVFVELPSDLLLSLSFGLFLHLSFDLLLILSFVLLLHLSFDPLLLHHLFCSPSSLDAISSSSAHGRFDERCCGRIWGVV